MHKMGTWCTEGVKRSMAEHRREEHEKFLEEQRQKNYEYEERCEKKGICPKCKQKLPIKKKKKD